MANMDFIEFCENIKDIVPVYLGWENIEKAELHKVIKNNDITLTGLIVREKNSDVSPQIYLDEYYSQYLQGMSFDEIMNEIINDYGHAMENVPEKQSINYDTIESKLFVTVVNYERNREYLKDCVHERYLDLAVTARLLYMYNDNQMGSAKVTYDMLDYWGKSSSEIMETAKENTGKLFPAVALPLDQVLDELTSGEDHMPDSPFYVVTNRNKINGATNILFPEIIAKEVPDSGDMYVIPSSIHELLLIPVSFGMDYRDVKFMVEEVNKSTVAANEFLSDNVYKYDAKEKTISMAAGEQENVIKYDLGMER